MENSNNDRLVYVDPNNLASIRNGNIMDNMTWNPEDLNISVDIQVIIPDRDNCGKRDYTDEGTVFLKPKRSFFSGQPFGDDEKHNFLSTSFVNVSYSEIKNNKSGERELLGVESIDINFDSHFFPQVTIKFTDVRGASLMMPEESAYAEGLAAKAGKEKTETYENFFRSLFHFPYPLFYLTIKGFYGTRETFILSVEDFKASFNSTNGNFDVTVKFIGHMYGIYSDLPFNYLIIAPYIGGSNNAVNDYWQNSVDSGKYRFIDGTEIPTFIKFIEKYRNIDDAFTTAMKTNGNGFKNVAEVIKNKGKLSFLKSIISTKDEYDREIRRIFAAEGNAEVVDAGDYIILFKKDNKELSIPKGGYNNIIKAYNDFKAKYEEDIEGNYCLDKYMEDNDAISTSPIQLKTIGNEGNIEIIHYSGGLLKDIRAFNESITADTTNVFSTDVSKNTAYRLQTFYCIVYRKFEGVTDFFGRVRERIKELEEEINDNLEKNTEEYNELAKTVLGFVPTLENIFRMIYAHIDCYMSQFYGTLSNVNTEMLNSSRRNDRLEPVVDIAESTDIMTKGKGDSVNLPPFTGFFKRDTETKLRNKSYPNDYKKSNGRYLAEVDFVEQIYQGIASLPKVYETFSAETENRNTAPTFDVIQRFNAISPLDVIYNGENPYYCLKDNENRQEFLKDSVIVYTHRILTTLAIKSLKDIDKIGFSAKGDFEILNNEINNLFSVLTIDDKKRLFNEVKTFNSNTFDKRSEILCKFFSDKTLKKRYKTDISTKRIVVDFPEELIANVYDLKRDEAYDSLDTEGKERIDFQNSLKYYKGSYPIKNITKLSDSEFAGEFGKVKGIEKWTYNKDESFSYGGLRLYTNSISPTYNSGNIGDKNYSGIINNVIDKANGMSKESVRFVSLQVGTDKKQIKNLYFEENFRKISNITERATIFLSTIIGTTDITDFIDEKTYFLRMPKFVRLFLGSQIKEGKITVTKNGIYDKSKKPAKSFNKKTIEEIDEFCGEILKTEFIEWVNSEFKEIDKIFEKYSTSEYIKEQQRKAEPICYDVIKTKELQNIFIDFYLETVNTIQVSVLKKSFYLNFYLITKFVEEIYKKLSADPSVNEEEPEGRNEVAESEKDAETIKNEIYYTLKGLYDKWLCCLTKERFLLNSPDVDRSISQQKTSGSLTIKQRTEYNSFIFMDSFYNEIGQTFYVDTKVLYDILMEQIGYADVQRNRSTLEFISDIAEKHKLLFIALPVYNNFHNPNTINEMFKPHLIYDGDNGGERRLSNTYLLMYTHEASHNLGIEEDEKNGVGYRDDGYDLADTLGVITREASEVFSKGGNIEKLMIPAFGVTFARQNQSYFKNISVNMDSPRQTDFSIYNKFMLAGQEKRGDVNSPVTVGQNMYSIYSNRSYDCHVEMLGCANIMPTMYFQLNNIPLFKGAYMITKVEHHIKPGDMTTKFSGTRMSKNAVPYVKCPLKIEEMVERITGGDGSQTKDIVNTGTTEAPLVVSGTKISKWFTYEELTYSTTANSKGIKNIPNTIEYQHLIELAYWLDGLRDYLGYPIVISSGFRCPELNAAVGGAKTSAHRLGYAADLQPGKGSFLQFQKQVREYCLNHGVHFDQCIIEKNSKGSQWVHIGLYNESGEQRHQVFDLKV
jgi:hypothetical protein